MTRYAVVEDDVVVNVAVADADFAQSMGWVLATPDAVIGATWDGSVFTPPNATPTVPEKVFRRQALQALLIAGKLAEVQPAIDAMPDPLQRGLAQIEWNDSLEFERNRQLVIDIGAAIGLDSAALDALFITAAGL